MKTDASELKGEAVRESGAQVRTRAPAEVLRERLRDSVASVGDIANVLVHDFKGPLAGLTTSLELITGSMVGPEDLPQLHQAMKNQLAKLNDLLNRGRELYRLSQLEMTASDIARVLRPRLEESTEECAAREITYAFEIMPGEMPVMADEEALQEALGALIGNALNAMDRGGELHVSVVRDEASGDAVITVRDTGTGIPANALPNVFRPFYTTRKGAAGMGLTVARQLVIAHGGEITLASEQGKGTTATMRVPLA